MGGRQWLLWLVAEEMRAFFFAPLSWKCRLSDRNVLWTHPNDFFLSAQRSLQPAKSSFRGLYLVRRSYCVNRPTRKKTRGSGNKQENTNNPPLLPTLTGRQLWRVAAGKKMPALHGVADSLASLPFFLTSQKGTRAGGCWSHPRTPIYPYRREA